MTSCFYRVFRSNAAARLVVAAGAFVLATGWLAWPVSAQTLIYQEGFNTDGETNVPPRYTTGGHDVYEPDRILSELLNGDQKGPIYWARNTEVSFVGIPNIPARRMIFTLRPGTDETAYTEDLLKLFDSSVKWLLNGKTNATVSVSPNVAAIGILSNRLAAAGHTLIDDDASVLNDLDIQADLYIHGLNSPNSSRYVRVPKPAIVMSASDYDDTLLAGIGLANVTFEPGQVTITATNHPAAGGKTGSFNGFAVAGNQSFELINRFLPPDTITLATVDRTVAPTVARLPDVDEIIAGTRQSSSTTATVTEIDFADGNPGSWLADNPIPGGYTGVWALQVKGKISVAAPGTYRFALGSADGALLRIDRDTNGLTAADNVIQDFGPHNTHTYDYNDVDFAAAGTYDFEIRSFNSGAAGSLELSVATQAGDIPDDAQDSGYWELLGTAGAVSPVKLVGPATATAYTPTGADTIEKRPLIVLFNGPNDTPPGHFNGGGPFTGFEGTGFYAGSGMNKFPNNSGQAYRYLTLKPVNVAGKTNVRMTVALAAAQIDFEDTDYLDIYVYPNGATSTPIQLAHFRGVENGVQPWLADQKKSFVRPLAPAFNDFTYNIPTNATDLIVEFRVLSTWWNEILAIDNVRITEGAATQPPPQISNLLRSGNNVTITWINGGTLEWTTSLSAPITWTSTGDSDGSYTEAVSGNKYFHVKR